jgi:hypothetical protein
MHVTEVQYNKVIKLDVTRLKLQVGLGELP